ncbi:hypothetical protein [Sphingomonas jatrophae]|uniref:Uncharacterized protein n=1 Tax=Sphingomonas jatrophae TaxID=1166337 RepID=A0A1I6JMT2_9SPHN|nr:hypothetical protein [Sphingomonas jatrophae]SFR80285.1 hypothetical protein SAMN05192580_0553 [Sphingomonas jatrophae]
MRLSMIPFAMLAVVSVPALSQTSVPPNGPTSPTRELPYDRGYDKPSARADAVNAAEAPVTADLNTAVNGATVQRDAAAEAQYRADRDAYMVALARHDRAVNRSDARYARQQIAYADAMAAWREQVRACKKGYRRACDAPAPNVADFY